MEEFVVLDNLQKSVDYMLSDDWKERFISEYAQLVTRINRLLDVLWEWTEEEQKKLNCPMGLLSMQIDKMAEYQQILEIRAELYGINLNEELNKLNL